MKKILLVDDDQMVITLMNYRLKKDGFGISICHDGKSAIQYLNSSLPDVVIVDIMMPKVSGFEVLRYLRNILKSNIPVIVLSSINDEDTLIEAFELGANEFVTKPFNPEEIVIRIKKLLLHSKNFAGDAPL